jgi:hypothetical protein
VIKTVGLVLAFLFGAGSLVAVGVTLIDGTPRVAAIQPPQRVEPDAKVVFDAKAEQLRMMGQRQLADRSLAAEATPAANESVETDRDAAAALALAPVIFAQPSGAASPLLSEPADPAHADPAHHADADAKADWRNANAMASPADVESHAPLETHRVVKPARVRKPRVEAAQDKPAVADHSTCVQPTGLNGFLASLNLKPRCEIGASEGRPAG